LVIKTTKAEITHNKRLLSEIRMLSSTFLFS